jgi:hypothetical protein
LFPFLISLAGLRQTIIFAEFSRIGKALVPATERHIVSLRRNHPCNLPQQLGLGRLTTLKRLSAPQVGRIIKEDSVKHRVTGSLAVLAMMLMFSSPSPARGRHPQIEAALSALQNAKAHLQEAAHDFGGHRVDAIHAIDEADRQLRICMNY